MGRDQLQKQSLIFKAAEIAFDRSAFFAAIMIIRTFSAILLTVLSGHFGSFPNCCFWHAEVRDGALNGLMRGWDLRWVEVMVWSKTSSHHLGDLQVEMATTTLLISTSNFWSSSVLSSFYRSYPLLFSNTCGNDGAWVCHFHPPPQAFLNEWRVLPEHSVGLVDRLYI